YRWDVAKTSQLFSGTGTRSFEDISRGFRDFKGERCLYQNRQLMEINRLQTEAIELLKRLIETPSFSKEEDETANLLEEWLTKFEIPFNRHLNNVWSVTQHFDASKPTLLLNSHHDTVKPNSAYTKNPFTAEVADGKLFGLGSNDAGGCLVSLLATFTWFYKQENLKYNLIFAGTAEEEINGNNGIASLLPLLRDVDLAIVGEPTLMQLDRKSTRLNSSHV